MRLTLALALALWASSAQAFFYCPKMTIGWSKNWTTGTITFDLAPGWAFAATYTGSPALVAIPRP